MSDPGPSSSTDAPPQRQRLARVDVAVDDPLSVLTELVPTPVASPTDGAANADRSGGGRAAKASRKPRRSGSAFWRFGFPAIMVALTVAIPVLVTIGRKTILQSTDGRLLTEITDPSQPGYQAIATPTPTMLLVQTDAAGKPNGLTVMALTGDGAGGLVFVPMNTVLDLPDIGKIPLSKAYESGGIQGLQTAVEGVVGTGMSAVQVVGPQQWADLVGPVGPLTIENPDKVTVLDESGQEKVVFPTGTITVPASDVASYLGTTSPGESDLNRLVRHKAFWEAWLAKVGASTDANVVPGEVNSGLGMFVRKLATDRVQTFPLPVQGAGIPGSDAAVYFPVAEQVQSLVARLVPYPVGAPPGARPRIKILDGTGKLEHGLKAAPLLVEANGQIDQIGNATNFDVKTTTFEYYDDARRADVEKLQQELGVGQVVKATGDATHPVDVTITLGADFLAAPPRQLAPVSTAPSGNATTTVVGVTGD